MNKIIFIFLIFILSFFLLTGCAPKYDDNEMSCIEKGYFENDSLKEKISSINLSELGNMQGITSVFLFQTCMIRYANYTKSKTVCEHLKYLTNEYAQVNEIYKATGADSAKIAYETCKSSAKK